MIGLVLRCWLLATVADSMVIRKTETTGGAIPVDFYVFLGREHPDTRDAVVDRAVAPRASMNIKPPDDVSGFPKMCRDRCPMFDVSCGHECTSPQMRWCRCVAEYLVKDLATDFGALLDEGSAPVFELGDYAEIDAGQDLFSIPDGHTTLYSLMEQSSSVRYSRRAGRVAVWVASHIATGGSDFLGGTTLLDQPLWQDGKGAGVLFHAESTRSSKILSHEIGHVVGFHHTAGPSMMYQYDHAECPEEHRHVQMHPLVFPNCEHNIMGYWYDGPYCCPGESPSSFAQFLAQSHRQPCIADPLADTYCCGSSCNHDCPKEMPPAIFHTKAQKHGADFSRILKCWLHLRTLAEPKKDVVTPSAVNGVGLVAYATTLVQNNTQLVCVDFEDGTGHC